MLEGQFAHLAGADDQDGLVVEAVEDVASDVDRDARDRELALVQPGLVAGPLGGARARWKTVWRIGPMAPRPVAAL